MAGRKAILKKFRKHRTAVFWVVSIAAVILLAFLFSVNYCKEMTVNEGSMDPTISAGQTVLIHTSAYAISSPGRGDMIAFRTDNENDRSLHVKRVIGLPGETIRIDDGKILINGKEYKERQDFPEIIDPGIAEMEIELDEGEYFVLGDNRNGSEDSRYATVGNIRREQIVGLVWLKVKPLGSFGIIR